LAYEPHHDGGRRVVRGGPTDVAARRSPGRVSS